MVVLLHQVKDLQVVLVQAAVMTDVVVVAVAQVQLVLMET
jgi:hypothetical protein